MHVQKAGEKHADTMFYQHEHAKNECQSAAQDEDQGLEAIKGVVARRSTLREMILVNIKGLKWKKIMIGILTKETNLQNA